MKAIAATDVMWMTYFKNMENPFSRSGQKKEDERKKKKKQYILPMLYDH